MDVGNYVTHMLQCARYPLRAIPEEAVTSAAVDYYVCEVENGGHNQFIGNSGWDSNLRHKIRGGLAILGLSELVEVFTALEFFAASDPEKFHASDWSDPTLQRLDRQFNEISLENVFTHHAGWLRTLPALRILPDTDYHVTMDAITDRNRIAPRSR